MGKDRIRQSRPSGGLWGGLTSSGQDGSMVGQIMPPFQWGDLKFSVELISEGVVAIDAIQAGTRGLSRVGHGALEQLSHSQRGRQPFPKGSPCRQKPGQ